MSNVNKQVYICTVSNYTEIMLSYEKYEENTILDDKYKLKNVHVSKCTSYNGEIHLINDSCLNKDTSHTPPLAAAVVGVNNTAIPLPADSDLANFWTDVDAHEAYLSTKPTSYLILGKPGLGSYSLGESLSKKLNCVHLSSRNVVLDEIEQQSTTGKCLDFNMRHNKVCKFDIILVIMQRKLESQVIKHRGYILSGLPLVTSNKKEEYFSQILYAEESLAIVNGLLSNLVGNLKRKKLKQKVRNISSHSSLTTELDNTEEEVEEEQQPELVPEEVEEPIIEMPKYLLDVCCDIVPNFNVCLTTKKGITMNQIQELFNFQPDIIINIMSPDYDAVTKKSRKYFNYLSNLNTFNSFELRTDFETRWPHKYTINNYSKTYENHMFNPKYNCKQPINFIANAMNQLCNYKNIVSPLLEEKLKDYDTRNVLKIDGRSSVQCMSHYIMGKLLLMPIKPVLIPKPFYFEEPSEDYDEFWSSIKQFNAIKNGGLNFNRYASQWYTRCPVELKKRRSVQGKSKLAVSFFQHVFLLSSLDAMIKFCKNPRPYLKLMYLEPTCRVIIIGTKSSGKTMIANCLSWLFDTPIICYENFVSNERQKKYENFSKSILSEIIATIEDARHMKWQTAETERILNLNKWLSSVKNTLNIYIHLFEKNLKFVKKEQIEENISISEVELKKIEMLRNQLFFLPFIDDLKLCKDTILDTKLTKYAPIELITETTKPKLPVLGDNDVTEAISAYIVANELQKDIEPTTEELMIEMIQIIFNINKETLEKEDKFGKYIIDGFPSDQGFWNYLDTSELLPDYIIVLMENREIDIQLLKSYILIDKSRKIYQERFVLSSDPLVELKKKTSMPLDNAVFDIKIILDELLDYCFDLFIMKEEDVDVTMDMVAAFNNAIEKFKEEWDLVKVKAEENSKATIVVEIENKSDIQILDEVLLKLRQGYYLFCSPSDNTDVDDNDDDDIVDQDLLTYNDPYYMGETNIYCPVGYYDYGIMWEGKSEFCTQFDNKSYYFCKEEYLELFKKDVTKYLSFNKPFKVLPPLRICVIGSIGSGKTTLSKQLAKELGVIHVDFSEFVNYYLMPKHFGRVGRQYENSFTDTPMDDETVFEFQVDEENAKMIPDILFNETEIRRSLYNYFEKGIPLVSSLVQKVIRLLWNSKPFSKTGFVLDGFPKLPSDIEDMIVSFCIPDLIIDLQGSSEITLQRLSSKMLKKWKEQLSDAKNKMKIEFEKKRLDWFNAVTREVVIKLIIDEIINNAFTYMSMIEVIPEKNISVHSIIIDAHPSGSENVDANLFNTYNDIIKLKPEPVDDTQWEKPDDVLERINARLESIFEIDDENIQSLKEILTEQKIKNVSVNGTKSATKIFKNVLTMLTASKNRNESFFEQTFIVPCDIAEILLTEGFYMISKFYRMCPVYISENTNVISNPYNICKQMNQIFPVIHRSYIYFINSVDNVKKFRKNPLKYIASEAIKTYQEYPIRIGIIGMPKSGKSELASKLAKRYDLLYISRGQAIRHVLENIRWSELALKIEKKLLMGEYIDSELIMKAVHTVTIDHRVVTNGVVFDGFPDQPVEATELLRLGLYPLIIIDVNSNTNTVIRNSQNEIYYNLLKRKPPYSPPFIEYRDIKWREKCTRIKEWINEDIQNLYTICGDLSKWQCYQNATQYIENTISKVKNYFCNVNSKIVPAGVMCFSNEIFEQRMSSFKKLCPICLRKNTLRHSGFPNNKAGLVQFGNNLYWFCPDHMKCGLSHPDEYLKGSLYIPEIPVPVKTIAPMLLYENGICMVTYTEHLPSQKIIRGDRKLAASYDGRYYLFCSVKCMQKFMEKPHMYYNVSVFKETSLFPKISVKSLPNLGYLEQTLGNILTTACCYVNVTRPKYPGLNIQVSGLLHIALYLKFHNPSISQEVLALYEEAYKVYEARCKLIHDIGFRLRSMHNPFAKYPSCCSPRGVVSKTTLKSSSINSTPVTLSSSELGFIDRSLI